MDERFLASADVSPDSVTDRFRLCDQASFSEVLFYFPEFLRRQPPARVGARTGLAATAQALGLVTSPLVLSEAAKMPGIAIDGHFNFWRPVRHRSPCRSDDTPFSIRVCMSLTRHAVDLGPRRTGCGYRPTLTPAHHDDLLKGIGPRGARMSDRRKRPIRPSMCVDILNSIFVRMEWW